MSTIKVHLGKASHKIKIGKGVIDRLGLYLKSGATVSRGRRGFLIYDKRLPQAKKRVSHALRSAGWELTEVAVQAGEGLKDFKSVYLIYGKMLKAGISRDSVLFALGGGSVGDAAGFIASTYLRGIPWVSLPTTLLAQVDSAVGGKTAINHDEGKNLIGSFHQPSLIVCETEFLKSLSQRELVSGLGEIIKYGLVFDPWFYRYLVHNYSKIIACDQRVLAHVIKRTLQWKVHVVEKDEFDRTGIREVLNFGHTFGHAIETETKYKTFQHGEAVIWGMRFALALSLVRGKLIKTLYEEMDGFLKKLPVPKLSGAPERFLSWFKRDKKIRANKLHFVLLKGLGNPVSDCEIQLKELLQAASMIGCKENNKESKARKS